MDDPALILLQEWNKHRKVKLAEPRTAKHKSEQEAKSDKNEACTNNHEQQLNVNFVQTKADCDRNDHHNGKFGPDSHREQGTESDESLASRPES